ncbi:MAG: cyclase family protein [Bacteroidales bacterium]
MEIIDLTQTISSTMPVYPGTEPPVITDATTIEKDGFAEKRISFFSHTGTHIDAPGHILRGRSTLDQFNADKFIGKGLVIDVTKCKTGIIEKECLEKYSAEIAGCDFIIFRTGWDKKWGTENYFIGFPILSADAVKWLCSFNIKGIGFDCISVDPVDSAGLPNHRILLNKDLVIVENLCNLDQLTGLPFLFSCLPLKIENSDGSPVRAVGIM